MQKVNGKIVPFEMVIEPVVEEIEIPVEPTVEELNAKIEKLEALILQLMGG